MGYREDKGLIVEWRDGYLADHQFRKAECKSWFMGKPGTSGVNAFSVTWSYPGTLTLAGDLGELTLTHYHAMPNWWSAVRWLRENPDHDYFLGKSTAKREFDPEGTLQVLIEHLTEVAQDADVGGYQRGGYLETPKRQMVGSFDMNEVFVAKVSDEFIETMRDRLEEGESEAAELCRDLGMDDYYGSQRWPAQRVVQMACLFRWAQMVAETDEYKQAVESARCRAELLRQVEMHDKRMPLMLESGTQPVGLGNFIRYLPREAA